MAVVCGEVLINHVWLGLVILIKWEMLFMHRAIA